jgi:hypothetical protein
MAELEQAAHFGLKTVPAEAIAWMLPDLSNDLVFTRWLDTNLIAFPGEPGRRCDTVAELVSRSGTSPPWALVLEVEARSRYSFLGRAWEYAARLWRKLRHGPRRRDRYLVAAVVLFLSGRRKDLHFHMVLPGTDVGFNGNVRPISLRLQKAADVLGKIARAELGRSILMWVPLMDGGGEPATVQGWVRLATLELNEQRRSEYAGVALVFAEWAEHRAVWQQALEGFNVRQLEIVREWKDEARLETRLEERRHFIRMVLQKRFPPEVPPDLARTIQEMADLPTLLRWCEVAVETPSLDAFRGHTQTSSPGNG